MFGNWKVWIGVGAVSGLMLVGCKDTNKEQGKLHDLCIQVIEREFRQKKEDATRTQTKKLTCRQWVKDAFRYKDQKMKACIQKGNSFQEMKLCLRKLSSSR
ncbi:MAG: hypothetical protein EP343_27375 [Deltaproteobacteria bacterium]|nr:MAG: hypothetical protein EP343_27375 [Deltaproteobacteria bacterium]